jgi:hypothetical protein
MTALKVELLTRFGFSWGFPDIAGSPAGLQIKRLDLLSRPRCPAQEFKAGINARIISEAFNIDPLA